jgi:hypothetical protein
VQLGQRRATLLLPLSVLLDHDNLAVGWDECRRLSLGRQLLFWHLKPPG